MSLYNLLSILESSKQKSPQMPDDLIATLFQDRYTIVLDLICIDYEAGLMEYITATTLTWCRCGIELLEISHCLELIGCLCALKSGCRYCIANIKPSLTLLYQLHSPQHCCSLSVQYSHVSYLWIWSQILCCTYHCQYPH